MWFILILLVVGAWVGWRIAQVYFDHETLKNETAVIVERALVDRSYDPRGQIVKLFEGYGVSLDPEALKIAYSETGDRISVAFPYSRSVNLGLANPSLHFEIYAQRESAKAAGVIQSVRKNLDETSTSSSRKYQESVKNAFGVGGR